MADDQRQLRWQDLDGQERYRVVEMIRTGEVEIKELSRTFGVSRQTLHRAVEAADTAAVEALTRKRRGRKPEPATTKQVRRLESQNRKLEQDLHQMSQRYEVAKALLELQRQAERGEALGREKKTLHPLIERTPTSARRPRPSTGMADRDDGREG